MSGLGQNMFLFVCWNIERCFLNSKCDFNPNLKTYKIFFFQPLYKLR